MRNLGAGFRYFVFLANEHRNAAARPQLASGSFDRVVIEEAHGCRDRHACTSKEASTTSFCAANHREPIFFCAADRDGFAALVGEVIERFRVHHALERRIATMSTLARHFGRSASTLCETLERYRNSRPELFKAPLKLP